MNRICLTLIVVVLGSLSQVGMSQGQDLPVPVEFSTLLAWFLVVNPDYEPESQFADSTISAGHIQYQLRLVKDGKSIVGGGLGPISGDMTVGLTILRASTKEEAQALAEADPAVRAGRLIVVVREWWVPSEQMR